MSQESSKHLNLLTLVEFKHPILRKVLETVTFPLSAEDTQLIKDMKYSVQSKQLKAANAPWDSAAGMAANQWGFNKRIFVYCPNADKKIEVMINPSYEPLNETEDLNWEGCFSVPLATGCVKRYTNIRVKYQNELGETIEKELSGRLARVFQHETDHTNGHLYSELGEKKCLHHKTFATKAEVDAFYDTEATEILMLLSGISKVKS